MSTFIPVAALALPLGGSTGASPGSSLAERVGRLEDLEDIRTLRNMYHYFLNERMISRFSEIYIPEGCLQMDESLKWTGVDNIIAGLSELSRRVKLLKQFIHNHQVNLSGNSATGFAYFEARYAVADESLMVAGKYEENYVRTEKGWRIDTTLVSLIFSVPLDIGWAGNSLNYFKDGRP